MSPPDQKKRHVELVRELRSHDYRYYVLDDPALSDRDYDALYHELVALEKRHPELQTTDSPTKRIGGELPLGPTDRSARRADDVARQHI